MTMWVVKTSGNARTNGVKLRGYLAKAQMYPFMIAFSRLHRSAPPIASAIRWRQLGQPEFAYAPPLLQCENKQAANCANRASVFRHSCDSRCSLNILPNAKIRVNPFSVENSKSKKTGQHQWYCPLKTSLSLYQAEIHRDSEEPALLAISMQ